MPANKRSIFILVFVVLSLWSESAFACKCDKLNPIRESAMIFFGTVENIRPRGSTDGALFKVEEVYKGNERDSVRVFANRFGHDCGIRFEEGKSYVVYAKDFRPRGVATSQCWKTFQSDSPPGPDGWKTPKGEIRESTDLEKELRKLVKKPVHRCGGATRAKDAGFSMVMSPSGDPVPYPTTEKLRPAELEFRRCVVDRVLELDDLPRPEEPVVIDGWFQYGDRYLPVLLDERPCGEECPDWGSRVRSAMVADREPSYEEASLSRDYRTCVDEGLDAIAGDGDDRRGRATSRRRVTIDCAVRRGEFEKAKELLDAVDLEPAFAAAIEWAASAASAEEAFPVGGNEPQYPDHWFDDKRGESTPGGYRVLRNAFVASDAWAHQPLYLEAFAESILGDEDAPPKMKDIAAVAYHRAALLAPEKADAYRARANSASKSKRARMMMDEITKALQEPEPEAEAEPLDEQFGIDEQLGEPNAQMEAEGGDDDQTLLYIGAGLVLLAMIGIFLLKTRNG